MFILKVLASCIVLLTCVRQVTFSIREKMSKKKKINIDLTDVPKINYKNTTGS